MREKIKKYISLVRQGRFEFILQAVAWSVPRWLFFFNHAVFITSDNPAWESQACGDCEIRLGSPDDIEMLERIGINRVNARARFDFGERVGIAIVNGEIVTAVWGGSGKRFLKYSGACFDPGPDGVFYYGAYTRADVRNKGYFSAARMCLYNSFIRDGRPRNWGVISANNPKWLTAVLRKNFTRAGETVYIKALCVNFLYYRKWPGTQNRFKVFLRAPHDILNV